MQNACCGLLWEFTLMRFARRMLVEACGRNINNTDGCPSTTSTDPHIQGTTTGYAHSSDVSPHIQLPNLCGLKTRLNPLHFIRSNPPVLPEKLDHSG